MFIANESNFEIQTRESSPELKGCRNLPIYRAVVRVRSWQGLKPNLSGGFIWHD